MKMPLPTLILIYQRVPDPNTRGEYIYSLKSPTGLPIHPDYEPSRRGSSQSSRLDEMPAPVACQLAMDIININRSSLSTHGASGRYALMPFLLFTISPGFKVPGSRILDFNC